MVFEVWRDTPIVAAALPQTLFVLLFAVRPLGAGRWWKDFVGKALFLKSTTLALLLVLVTTGMVVEVVTSGLSFDGSPPESAFDRAEIGCYWLVCGAIYYQFLALLHERRHPRSPRS